jgi:hypothetical protein
VFDPAGNYVLGEIDDVAVWDTALSPTQILALANKEISPLGTPPGGGGALPFQISDISINEAGDQVTLSWPSREGESYAVEVSDNLEAWSEIEDGIPGAGDTTSFPVPIPDGVLEQYYRITLQ